MNDDLLTYGISARVNGRRVDVRRLAFKVDSIHLGGCTVGPLTVETSASSSEAPARNRKERRARAARERQSRS